ncbi:MAG: radical SAM family heme chaperone HemW, partial [Bacteroidia bacterium]|nr:radical SAM family heme chaperone HemW [Bacteroidia bacterium]
GTPSVLSVGEIDHLIRTVHDNYSVIENPEVTLEANPDDLSKSYIKELSASQVNRLSIGIQSFFDSDLKLMNRAHSAKEASSCLDDARHYFDNISIDLIYGIPYATDAQWQANIDKALSYDLPHISSYALTVEPKTALASFIKNGKVPDIDETRSEAQFYLLIDALENANYHHYEVSNFGKEGYFSKNNSAYWRGKSYLGIGPSAHSFNGKQRSWNISNNSKYINALKTNNFPSDIEHLSQTDRYNEFVMTGLRTIWGVSIGQIQSEFGTDYKKYLLDQADLYIKEQLLYIEDDKLKVTKKGKFLSDGIASKLFKLNS